MEEFNLIMNNFKNSIINLKNNKVDNRMKLLFLSWIWIPSEDMIEHMKKTHNSVLTYEISIETGILQLYNKIQLSYNDFRTIMITTKYQKAYDRICQYNMFMHHNLFKLYKEQYDMIVDFEQEYIPLNIFNQVLLKPIIKYNISKLKNLLENNRKEIEKDEKIKNYIKELFDSMSREFVGKTLETFSFKKQLDFIISSNNINEINYEHLINYTKQICFLINCKNKQVERPSKTMTIIFPKYILYEALKNKPEEYITDRCFD